MHSSYKGHRKEPIAVIGNGCRFPGGAATPAKLWDLLREPWDVRSTIPSNRFDPDGFLGDTVNSTHHGYFLTEDYRTFDASFFGVKPVEAKSIDPQQRLLLEVVYESIEAAGLSMAALRGTLTAIYVGLMAADYNDLLNRDTSDYPPYIAAGTARSMISNRVSYFFDWRGPSMTIDTACSSSLVAVHQAVQALRSGDATVAVAAGANLLLGPEQFIAGSNMKMLSPDGRSRMWDSKANGYARGDGIAAVVLKTLSAALADGDDIECVIVETGLNQDGRTQGLTVPNATAQAALIKSTYKKAGLDLCKSADRPQYFEAHGTGTPIGDPLEAEAIHTAFFKSSDVTQVGRPRDTLICGSIKTVIGHTEGTAGLAGLIKASLALKHGIIPPNYMFEDVASTIKPFYGNLRITTQAEPWPVLPEGSVRRASVNSFGFGGTNVHCILESYGEEFNSEGNCLLPSLPFVFSAPSEQALTAVVKSYSRYLTQNLYVDFRALSFTLSSRRHAFSFRVAFTAGNLDELRTKLKSFHCDSATKPTVVATVPASACRILGVFTGQGAQWPGMASRLMLLPAALKIIEELECSLAALPDPPPWSLKAELSADKSVSRVTEAAIAQPACTAVQILLVDLLRSVGISFCAVVGHSSGEIAAAYAAGYLTKSDAIRVAYYRGVHLRLVAGRNGESGTMMAVGTSFEEAENICRLEAFRGKICVAASNSASSVTLSGDITAIEAVRVMLHEQNKFARLLRVDNAYHSHHMVACSKAITRSLQACHVRAVRPMKPNCLWVSSVYQRDISEVADDLGDVYWHSNTVGPVLFSQALEQALKLSNFDLAVEVGAHPALKGPASQVIQSTVGSTLPYTGILSRGLDDVEAFSEGLNYVWAHISHAVVDFAAYDRLCNASAPAPKILKGLPSYPWNHERAFWHESRTSRAFRHRCRHHELLGIRNSLFSEDQVSWKTHLVPNDLPWILEHRIQGQIIFPAAGYISSAFEAGREVATGESLKSIELTDFVFGQPLIFESEEARAEVVISLTEIRRDAYSVKARFGYYSIAKQGSGPMSLNASAQLSMMLGSPNTEDWQPASIVRCGLVEVDHDRFYNSIASCGYHYDGQFKALTSIQRRMDVATGLIQVPRASSVSRLMVHPITLDATMHSILAAYCYPGDGRLRSVALPIKVSKMIINPTSAISSSREPSLRFVSHSVEDEKHSGGNVDVYTSDGSKAILRLEGLSTKAIIPVKSEDDVHMFSETVWGPASPVLTKDLTKTARISRGAHDGAENIQQAAAFVQQMTHRYPAMNILEIGEGSTDVAESVLAATEGAFASYTLTNLFGDHHDHAKEIFESYNGKVMYASMELEDDHPSQYFAERLYDLVVISSSNPRSQDLGRTLKSIRQLLKAGGYLVYAGNKNTAYPRSDSPLDVSLDLVRDANYNHAALAVTETFEHSPTLRSYGFAKTEWSPPEDSGALNAQDFMLVQAVDDRTEFLRDPLSKTAERLPPPMITLIGGSTPSVSASVCELMSMLLPLSKKLVHLQSLEQLSDVDCPLGGTVVLLQDHDNPIFEQLSERKLDGIKQLFARSKNVLWLINGYRKNAPHARMAIAFARCLLQEMPYVRLQCLDSSSDRTLDATIILQYLQRLLVTEFWEKEDRLKDLLWSVEPEVSVQDGQEFIPRVKLDRRRNDRYNSARRKIIHPDDVTMTVQPIDSQALFAPDGTYWLVGLTGALGLGLCTWMVTHGAQHIAISSRNPEIQSGWLDHFLSLGATVKVYVNDVIDRESVEATHLKIQHEMPPIKGVCHGAMVLQDALIADLDISRVEKVLMPKVQGAKHLDETFGHEKLDFFIMLSSIAATTGNPGQAAYAAANGFLSGLAADRRARGLAASTVNLGAVLGSGVVTRELTLAQQNALQQAGVMWTSEQDFHTAFAEAVMCSAPVPGATGEFNTGVRVCHAEDEIQPKHASSPVFSHLISRNPRDASCIHTNWNTNIIPIKAQLAQATSSEETSKILTNFLSTKLQAALQMSPDANVIDQTATALGIDSLVAVEMRSWFMKELNIDMPVLKIIGGGTMREVMVKAQELLSLDSEPVTESEATTQRLAATSESDPTSGKPHPLTYEDEARQTGNKPALTTMPIPSDTETVPVTANASTAQLACGVLDTLSASGSRTTQNYPATRQSDIEVEASPLSPTVECKTAVVEVVHSVQNATSPQSRSMKEETGMGPNVGSIKVAVQQRWLRRNPVSQQLQRLLRKFKNKGAHPVS